MHKLVLVCVALIGMLVLPSCEAPKQAEASQPLHVLSVQDELRILVVTFPVVDMPYWVNIQSKFAEVTSGLHLVGIEVQSKTGDMITALFYLVPTDCVPKYNKQQKDMKQQPQQPAQPKRPGKDQPGVQVPA